MTNIFQKITITYHSVPVLAISKAGYINIGCDFQNSHHISWNQKNNTELSSRNVTAALLKLKKKSQPGLYKIGLEGFYQEKCYLETRKIEFLCCNGLYILEEHKLEG